MVLTNDVDIKVRKATLDDVESISHLTFQLGYSAAIDEIKPRLKHLLNDLEHIVLVAEISEGKVVGWIHSYIYKLFYSDRAAEIGGIVVDNQSRGLGIGKKLMESIEIWAKENQCHIVSLRSNVIRKEAHCFYESIGYSKVKEQYRFRKKL